MGIGVWQVVIILAIVLIIFGAGKLPRVMGDMAKGIKNFKHGMQDDQPEEGQVTRSAEAAEPAPVTAAKVEDDKPANS